MSLCSIKCAFMVQFYIDSSITKYCISKMFHNKYKMSQHQYKMHRTQCAKIL